MANGELSPVSPELTAYMLRAVQKELSELRGEVHESYLNEAQMTNRFITREELREHARARREWPIVVATAAMAVTSIANLLYLLTAAH